MISNNAYKTEDQGHGKSEGSSPHPFIRNLLSECILVFSKGQSEMLLCDTTFSVTTLAKSCVNKGEPVCLCVSILPEIVDGSLLS